MSNLLLTRMLFGGRGRGRGFGGGKKRSHKKPKESYFHRITADQVKELCLAAKIKATGSKTAMMERLTANPATAPFASEGRAMSFGRNGFKSGKFGETQDSIKVACKAMKVSSTGSKRAFPPRLPITRLPLF